MFLSRKLILGRIMHLNGRKTQKDFMDYIKLSSEKLTDGIAAISKKESDIW